MLTAEEERPPYVIFETRAVEDRDASIKAGHYVSKDVNYALVTPPGSKDLHEEELEAWLGKAKMNARNGRMNPKWVEAWQAKADSWKKGNEIPEDGIPIKGWTLLSPAQCESLLYANIRTVEDLAQANDEGLSRIGMGALGLKKKAQAWLQATSDHGPLTMRVTALEQENAALKTQNESLILKNQSYRAQLETGEAPAQPAHVEPTNVITMADITPEPETIDIGLNDVQKGSESIDTLKLQYEQKFGKKPHWNTSEETLRKKLAE